MKKLLCLLLAFSPAMAVVNGPTATVTPSINTYSSAGGTITFTVNLTYTATQSALGFNIDIVPATWAYGITGGNNPPQIVPDPASTDNFSFAYFSIPTSPASFTFTVAYPANLTGDQTFTGMTAVFRPTGGTSQTINIPDVVISPIPQTPAFTTSPASVTVSTGGSPSFSVVATGFPTPTLQWRKGGLAITGATSSTFSISGATRTDAGSYDVVATNSQGSATSNAATLTVNFTPVFTTSPANTTVNLGQTANFSFVLQAVPVATFQWQKNGNPITGATNATLSIPNAQPADEANYTVVATNTEGSAISGTATLTVNTPPVFTTQPTGQTANLGDNITFTAAAGGKPTPVYQWTKNGAPISGATNGSFSITGATAADAATYGLIATNSVAAVPSAGAVLTFNPAISSLSNSSGTPGSTVTINGFGFTGATAITFNGVAAASFNVVSNTQIAAVVPTFATTGTIVVTTLGGSVTSSAFTVVTGPPVLSESIIGAVGNTDGSNLLGSFTIEGPSTTSVLIRGVGPSLAPLHISGFLADPILTVYDSTGTVIATNDDWGGDQAIANAMTALGAFALASSTSKDAVLLLTLNPGTYSVRVAGVGGSTGTALLDIYQAASTQRWGGTTSRTSVGVNGAATTGVFLGGSGTSALTTLLIRAVGTGLGITGAHTNPIVTVLNGSTQIASNDNWASFANQSALAAATAAVGAAPLAANDAALLITVPAGAYNVQASSATGTSGVVQTEVYVVDGYRNAQIAPALLDSIADASVAAPAGVTFAASYISKPAPNAIVWKTGGAIIPGATGNTFTLPSTVAANNGAQYRVEFGGASGVVDSAPITLNVFFAPTITTPPQDSTVNAGQAATFSVTATGNPAPTYQWKKGGNPISGATAATFSISNTQVSDAASYTVTVTDSQGSVTSSAATLVVQTAPTITTQPAANLSVNAGQPATFSVVATGIPAPTYQWTKGGSPVAGATSASFTIASTAAGDAASYAVIVSNVVSAVTSNPAVLDIRTLPVISAQPADQSAVATQSVTFTVAASGNPTPTYQWFKGVAPISGATNATFTINNLALSDAGTFSVTVTNSVGAVTSRGAVLQVAQLPVAPSISTQPANTTVNQGQTAAFSVSAGGFPTPTYQWSKDTVPISGATNATLSLANAQPANEGTYTVFISNSQGNTTSAGATLTVNTAPAFTTQPANVTVTEGGNATFTAAASGKPTPTLQWQKGTSNISGATSATLTLNNVQRTDSGSYRVLASNSVAANVPSAAATLDVQFTPTIGTQPASVTVNQGQTANFAATFTADPVAAIQWAKDGVAITGATSATLSIANAQSADEGTYSYTLSNGIGTIVTSLGAILTVNTPPVITTQPATISVNQGGTATFTVVATGKPAPTYQWKKGSAPITGATAATLTLPNVQITDNATYTVILTNTLGTVTSTGATLTVNTLPVITAQPSASPFYLVNGNLTLSVGASGVPTPTYQWRKGSAPIAGATSATFTNSSVQLTDAGSYDVVVTNSVGPVTSSAVTVTVYLPPAITTPPVAQSIVVGQNATFSVVATGNPTPTYQWQRNGFNVIGATGTSFTLTNVPFDGGGSITVVITNPGGAITSTPVTLTVNPVAPSITSPLTATGVVGRTFQYGIVANTSQATYGAIGLPNGLAINTATGVISGIPTATTSSPALVTISAANVSGNDSKTLAITVQSPPPVVTVSSAPNGRVGTAYAGFTVSATNSPTNFSATGLPPGLVIGSAGAISGTPTAVGSYTASVTASNATGANTVPLFITIDAPLNAPTFTGSTNLSGVQGTAFSFTPLFNTFTLTTTYNVTGLPSGLVFSSTTGAITGTPAVSGTFTVNVTATNSGGAIIVPFTLTVNAPATAPVMSSASTVSATVGTPFTFTLTSTGTPVASSYSATNLPALGLSLNAATGVISGTPSAPGTIAAQVRATNTVGTGPAAVLIITVIPNPNAPSITSAAVVQGRVGIPFSYTFSASNTPTTYTIASGTLPTGLLFSAFDTISGTPTQAGQIHVVFVASNAQATGLGIDILFNIAAPLTIPVVTSNGAAVGQVGQPFQYAIVATNNPNGYAAAGLPVGLTVDSHTGIISGIPTETSTQRSVTLTASNTDGTSLPKTLLLTINPAPATPSITSALNANARVGSAFTYTITASDSPTAFAALNLPPGLSIASTTGVISGTPTSSGTFTATLRAANAAGLGGAVSLTLNIAPAPTAPAITSAASASGKVGTAFTYTATAAPLPVAGFTLTGTLPLGLSFNTSTGIISGKPAETGVFTVDLTAASDGGTSLPQDLAINIAPADNVPVITSSTSANGFVGQDFSYTINATHTDVPPVTLDAVNLPPGVAVNPYTGVIQGQPTVAGTTTATLVGTNGNGTGPLRDLSIVIAPAPTAPAITSDGQISARVGATFNYQITASNLPTSFDALGAPAWLLVNAQNGALAGIPTAPGTYHVQLIATNSAGPSNPFDLTISVAAAAGTPVIGSSQTAQAVVGSAFTYQIKTDVTPTTYVITGMPSGLRFDLATTSIVGTPADSGVFNLTLSANNANGAGAPVNLAITIDTNSTLVVH